MMSSPTIEEPIGNTQAEIGIQSGNGSPGLPRSRMPSARPNEAHDREDEHGGADRPAAALARGARLAKRGEADQASREGIEAD